MKRLLALILTVLLLLPAALVPTQAAQSEHLQATDKLYQLGLVSGTGTDAAGKPIYGLDRAPTRSEAITVLVKLLGKADEASRGGWAMPFTDVPDWAKNFVGYAYQNGLTSGTSATTFGGNDPVTAAQYLTFVLKALGYSANGDFSWDRAWELSDRLGITDGRYNASTTTFLRGDVFLISEAALGIHLKGTRQPLAQKLIGEGAFTQSDYDRVYGSSGGLVELNSEQIFAQCSPAVFYVEVYNEQNQLFARGSGFFLESSGLAVTNHHVLEGATRAVITTSDTQQRYEVKGVYDFDEENDWAVMQVDGSGFASLPIGSPDTARGGATVYAIGSPKGLQNTISQGLVSNPDRVLGSVHYIQTSAPISNGSSGGALINKYGQVVGITSAGFDDGQNLNLAMPMTVLEGFRRGELQPIRALSDPGYAGPGSVDYRLSASSVTLAAGGRQVIQFSAAKTGIDHGLTYSISVGDETIADAGWEESESGAMPWGIIIEGYKAGSTTLTVSNDYNNQTVTIPITVTDAAAASNARIVSYINANRRGLLDAMEASFASSSGLTCTSDIQVSGMGFVITIRINELDNVSSALKAELQATYDAQHTVFDSYLTDIQEDLPELEYYKVVVCERDGDVLATVTAPYAGPVNPAPGGSRQAQALNVLRNVVVNKANTSDGEYRERYSDDIAFYLCYDPDANEVELQMIYNGEQNGWFSYFTFVPGQTKCIAGCGVLDDTLQLGYAQGVMQLDPSSIRKDVEDGKIGFTQYEGESWTRESIQKMAYVMFQMSATYLDELLYLNSNGQFRAADLGFTNMQ